MNDAHEFMSTRGGAAGSGRGPWRRVGVACAVGLMASASAAGLAGTAGCSTVRTQSAAFDFRRVVVQPSAEVASEVRQPTVASAGGTRTLGGE